MNKQKLKKWIKEHKKEILIGTASVIAIGTIGYLGIKVGKKTLKINGSVIEANIRDIDVDLDVATVTEAWTEDGVTNMILNDFNVKDIGELGADMIKNIPGVTEDTTLTCFMGTVIEE